MSISVCSATIHRYMPTCDSDIRNFIYIICMCLKTTNNKD